MRFGLLMFLITAFYTENQVLNEINTCLNKNFQNILESCQGLLTSQIFSTTPISYKKLKRVTFRAEEQQMLLLFPVCFERKLGIQIAQQRGTLKESFGSL